MTRVLHLLDGQADWEQRLAVSQLLARVPPKQCGQTVASLDRRVHSSRWFEGVPVAALPCDFGTGLLSAPALSRLIRANRIDVVHAWGPEAAKAAAAGADRGRTCRLVISQFDPNLPARQAKLLRTLGQESGLAFSCASETVRRRLVERGIAPDRCAVIRPGVDFAAINAAKRDRSLPLRLGLSTSDRVLVVGPPVQRGDGRDRAVWAGHLTRYIGEPYRTIVYGHTRQCHRLRRLSGRMPPRDAIVWAGAGYRYEALIAIADALVITPDHDVSTTAVCWAMAASTAVIGSAVYAVAELVAHRQSGLLIKPGPGPAMAVKIAECVRQIDSLTKEKEFARGSAYEAFGVRRFADQHARLYENLLGGAEAGHGIQDSARM